MLRKIGVADEKIRSYEADYLLSISEEFRITRPYMHPENGHPDPKEVDIRHLLGDTSDWDEVYSNTLHTKS